MLSSVFSNIVFKNTTFSWESIKQYLEVSLNLLMFNFNKLLGGYNSVGLEC